MLLRSVPITFYYAESKQCRFFISVVIIKYTYLCIVYVCATGNVIHQITTRFQMNIYISILIYKAILNGKEKHANIIINLLRFLHAVTPSPFNSANNDVIKMCYCHIKFHIFKLKKKQKKNCTHTHTQRTIIKTDFF